MPLHRLIDMAGSEIGIVEVAEEPEEGDIVDLPDGRSAPVLEVYDDEEGQSGGVASTIVVEI